MTTMGLTSIRLVLADDHPIVRSGLQRELATHSDIQIVGEAVNGTEALSLAETLCPDVLLLDINMPGLRGVEVVRRLRQQPGAPRVIILSAHGDDEHVMALLAAGARGYILKDENPSVIVDAIHAVMQGILWLSPGVAQVLEHRMGQPQEQAPELALTPREREVLRMIARGWDNGKIATSLNVTEATVKFHVTHIYDKLGVTSRVEAVLYAARHGLAELDGP